MIGKTVLSYTSSKYIYKKMYFAEDCYENSEMPSEKPAKNPSGKEKHENKSHRISESESHSPGGEQTAAVTETTLVDQRFANSLFLMCSEDALHLYSLKSLSPVFRGSILIYDSWNILLAFSDNKDFLSIPREVLRALWR